MQNAGQAIHPAVQSAAPFKGQDAIRSILGANIGQTLTPEIAAAIEMELRSSLEPLASKIQVLAAQVINHEQPNLPITHHFASGLYGRQIDIPAGTLLIGARHRVENMVVVSKGKILIATESGPMEFSAGDTLVCKPGTQNVGYALEDTRWVNVFPNAEDERDPDALVEMVSLMKADEILGGERNVQVILSGKAPVGELK